MDAYNNTRMKENRDHKLNELMYLEEVWQNKNF